MTTHTVNMGDVIVSSRKTNYICFGLGSCIGLFMDDRETNLSGVAHILLPEQEKGPADFSKFYNVADAIQELLARFKNNGSSLQALRAKIVGGANVINVNTAVGASNIESIIKHLTLNKIFIAAMDVGGCYSRTAHYETHSGILTVKIPEINILKIY